MENFTIIHYQINGKEIDVYLTEKEKTIWLSRKDIALLFNSTLNSINLVFRENLNYGGIVGSTIVEYTTVRVEANRQVRRKIKLYHESIIDKIAMRKCSNNFQKVKEYVSNYLNQNSPYKMPNNDIIIFDNGRVHVSVEISKREQTIWATESQIADAFEVSRQTINYHINNILKDSELEPFSVRKEILHTGSDGKQYLTVFYNLDMVLAIGYRVNSKIAIKFRRWATEILSNVIKQGYVINEERCIECKDATLCNFMQLSKTCATLCNFNNLFLLSI